MNKEIKLSLKIQILLKVLFVFSLLFMNLLFLRNCDFYVLLFSLILTFIIGLVLTMKTFKNFFANINTIYAVVSLFFGTYIAKAYFNFHILDYFNNLSYVGKFTSQHWVIISMLSIFALSCIVYLFILKIFPVIKKFYLNLSLNEKRYLAISLIISFLATVFLYYFVRGFYFDKSVAYDIYYTSDSAALFKGNAFLNVNMGENDLRQPLFGLFSLPFAIFAKLFSEIFYFVPNGYAVFLTVIQILLINVSVIMLCRLLKLKGLNQFLFSLIYVCTFSTVVFSFIMEQYIIGLFYLILTIYAFYEGKKEVNYAYIGAVSTLLTSGILFPFISKFKNWKYWLKNVFKCFILFIVLFIIFGQLPQIFYVVERIQYLFGFSGEKLLFSDKLVQYLAFVRSIFIFPKSGFMLDKVTHLPGYRVLDIYGFSLVGIGILILCLISFILNRKNKMAIISSVWILFSFVLLCVVGWGTAENGLILYSLYFSWAFIILLYLLIDKIIKNKKFKFGLIILICICLCIINIPEYINLIQFGLQHYGR